MKKMFILSLAVALSVAACAPYAYVPPGPPPPGPIVGGVTVAVGDQPYYVHGPYYIEHGRRRVWVNGHWGHRHGQRVWIHGRYVVRG
ncbi:MAG: hypothetical protein ACREIF_06530 [Chthoniobacterales bacterium]